MISMESVQATSDVITSQEYSREGVRYTGKAIIICNIVFKQDVNPRPVAQLDVDRLSKVLESVGFHVTIYNDKTSVEMTMILQNVARENLSDAGCFLCIFSSHGTWDHARSRRGSLLTDMIYAFDGPTPLKLFMDAVKPKQAPSLAGKPKIFLLQHCRGDRYQASVDVTEAGGDVLGASLSTFTGSNITKLRHSDGSVDFDPEDYRLPYVIPVKRDFFLHYATVPGFVSFKQGGVGTPFLKAWCDVLSSTKGSREIHDMATVVNAIVSQLYESNAPSKATSGGHLRKQMPQIVSMLTRDFYLPPPSQQQPETAELADQFNVQLNLAHT